MGSDLQLTGEGSAIKPWDSRVARYLIRPLRHTRVHPNHITTASLLAGLGAAALFATGSRSASSWGGVLYILSALLDHADGELARLADKASVLGQTYDRAADLVARSALFMGIGLGLSHGSLGRWAILCGVVSATTLVLIFALRSEMARRGVPGALDQPSGGGLDLGDALYLIAPLAWMDVLAPFLVATSLGTPVFCWFTARQYRRACVGGAGL